jgi:TusA-related sulfurtransferase
VSDTGPVAEAVLDARGKRCPLPVIELARTVPSVAVGGVVVVLADDPAADADIPAWCRMRGQDYLGAEPAGDGRGSAYRVRRAS